MAESDEDSFMVLIHGLVILLAELEAGVMRLKDCLGISREPIFREFKIFLQTMEVYGGGYKDDVDYARYNLRLTQSHKESMI
jgi:hypothetical protein